MMVLPKRSVDDVRGNRTDSVPEDARKWRSGAGYASCVKLSQPYNSGSLFVAFWPQACQQAVELIETAELHGQLATALGRQLDLHTQA